MSDPTPLTSVTAEDIDEIALGAAVLGTGGGGDPHIGALHAKRSIRLYGEVPVTPLNALADDELVVPIGMIGAPSVSIEKIAGSNDLTRALDLFEQASGRTIAAIMPIEIGGGNSLLPIAAAAERHLPIVDADAMGRAFPEAQMVTFQLAGYGPGTTVLVDSLGNTVVCRPVSATWSERLARVLTFEMGGSATMIDYAYPGAIVRDCAIGGTLTLAKRIGRILSGNDLRDDQRIDSLLRLLDGYQLFTGKVDDVHRTVTGGFTRGKATIAGLGTDRGSNCELHFQNEMLFASRDGQPLAMTPDLIAVLDLTTGHPITTETLRYGNRVAVVAFPCSPLWRTPRGLETAGPGYFGYDVPYLPVEVLAEHTATHPTAESLGATAKVKS